MKPLNVLVLFDSAGTPPEDQDFTEVLKEKEWATEANVIKALEGLGHDLRLLGIYDDIGILAKEIKKNKPDIIFNLTEVFLGKAYMDKNIPSFFELMGIPYTGCSPDSLMVCNNKVLTKKILSYHKIRVPNFHIFQKDKRIWHPKKLKFPLIVKPAREEASTGISQASFVENENDLQDRVRFIHDRFNMAAIAEEYIDGRELYLGMIGDKRLKALPLREMKFGQVPDEEPKMATYKAKWDERYRKKWGIKNEFADKLPQEGIDKIFKICKRAYKALLLDSYARFDLRLTHQGEIFIIEANANPALNKDEDFAESAKKAGINYEKLIQKLVDIGINRSGF